MSSQEPDGQLRGRRLGGSLVGCSVGALGKFALLETQSQEAPPLPGFTTGQNKQCSGQLPVQFAPELSQKRTAD